MPALNQNPINSLIRLLEGDKTKCFVLLCCAVFIASALMCSSANAGSIDFTYDNVGRLTGANYGADGSIAYTYNTNGNLLQRNVRTPGTQQHTLTVIVSPVTGGSVTGNGIDCPGDCTQSYDENTNAQLTANAEDAMKFLRWEGALTGTVNPDSLLMNADKQVTAYFGAESGNTDTDGVPDGTESGPAGDDPS